jgi:hypothetical protein
MYAVDQLGLWLDRFQHSRFARDLARDWRYWSSIERITACAVLVIAAAHVLQTRFSKSRTDDARLLHRDFSPQIREAQGAQLCSASGDKKESQSDLRYFVFRLWSCAACAMEVEGELFQPTRLLGIFYPARVSDPMELADRARAADRSCNQISPNVPDKFQVPPSVSWLPSR